MKARLINDFYAGTYKDNWLAQNQNKVVNGVLVSDWVLIDTIPTRNELNTLISPFWDGSGYIEGANQQEVDEMTALRNEREDEEENDDVIKDGQNLMNTYNVSLNRQIKDATLTANELKTIQNRVKGVYTSILFGWKAEAKDEADGLSTGGTPAVTSNMQAFKDLVAAY